jgi:uncharacterized SAM-binding protein YcdF (DUF218 family)
MRALAPGTRLITPRPANRRGRGFRRWRIVLSVVLACLLAFAVATARLLVWPAEGVPARVDAIVMLAGPGNRLPVALRLAQEHRAPVLVISRGWQGYGGPCPSAPRGVTLICFDANPGDTRGEAEYIGRLAERYHWSSIALVTTRPQDTRARILVQRCFSGTVYVATAPLPLGNWPYQIGYGWGALVKSLAMKRAC